MWSFYQLNLKHCTFERVQTLKPWRKVYILWKEIIQKHIKSSLPSSAYFAQTCEGLGTNQCNNIVLFPLTRIHVFVVSPISGCTWSGARVCRSLKLIYVNLSSLLLPSFDIFWITFNRDAHSLTLKTNSKNKSVTFCYKRWTKKCLFYNYSEWDTLIKKSTTKIKIWLFF